MKLNSLPSYQKSSKRLGRGRATGKGKTSGRGHKGQKARSGKKLRAGFEGGQTPIFQRLPKYRGFKNPNYVEYQVLNVSDLEKVEGKTVNREILLSQGLIRRKNLPVKILGNGDLSKALSVEVEKASQSAIDKITKAKGSFTSTVKEEAPKKEKAPKAAKEEKKEEAADAAEEASAEEAS